MAEKQKEGLDFLTRLRIRELILMGLILSSAVIIGLFLYLKTGLFIAVVLLIAGANMPDQIAEGLNISKIPIVLALVALVGVGLINYVVKLMPTGLEPRPKEKSAEGVRALFYAIEKNNLVYAQKVLSMNFEPNLHHDNGYSPLAYAAMRGSLPMVELLLRNGADPMQATKEGDSPVELALRFGHAEVADALKQARRAAAAERHEEEAAPATLAGS